MTYNFSWKDLLLFLAVTKKTNLKDFGLRSNCNYDVLHLHHKNFIGSQSYHRKRGFGSSHRRAPMLKSCLLLFDRVIDGGAFTHMMMVSTFTETALCDRKSDPKAKVIPKPNYVCKTAILIQK